ncbi:MAG: hypothetical protein ACK53Y_10760, partial [bacterium]
LILAVPPESAGPESHVSDLGAAFSMYEEDWACSETWERTSVNGSVLVSQSTISAMDLSYLVKCSKTQIRVPEA